MRLCVFADDDAKAEAHKKVSEVLGGTLTVTCQDGVEVWTVRNSYGCQVADLLLFLLTNQGRQFRFGFCNQLVSAGR
jgi:hypothetical protein